MQDRDEEEEVAPEITENEAKLRELILYVAQQCAPDPTYGAVRLNKILFHSDFFAYGQFGQPVTGAEYMKLEKGPAPRHLVPIRNDMAARGEIAIEKRPVLHGRPQERIVALRDPDLSLFGPHEIALIDSIIREMWGMTADEATDLTHGYRGWLVAPRLKDTIPYPAVFLSDEPPTEYERQHAVQLIREHSWNV